MTLRLSTRLSISHSSSGGRIIQGWRRNIPPKLFHSIESVHLTEGGSPRRLLLFSIGIVEPERPWMLQQVHLRFGLSIHRSLFEIFQFLDPSAHDRQPWHRNCRLYSVVLRHRVSSKQDSCHHCFIPLASNSIFHACALTTCREYRSVKLQAARIMRWGYREAHSNDINVLRQAKNQALNIKIKNWMNEIILPRSSQGWISSSRWKLSSRISSSIQSCPLLNSGINRDLKNVDGFYMWNGKQMWCGLRN